MSWKARVAVVGLAWIVVPWTWGMVEYQLRRRRGEEDADDGA